VRGLVQAQRKKEHGVLDQDAAKVDALQKIHD
jgi:hypothetical protein